MQRCDRWLTIETGLEPEARALLHRCTPLAVKIQRVPKRTIDRYSRLGSSVHSQFTPCIDLTSDETTGRSNLSSVINLGAGCYVPSSTIPWDASLRSNVLPGSASSDREGSAIQKVMEVIRGNCNWGLAPGFLEHVIAGGEVPDNAIATTLKKLFSPSGLLVILLNDALKNRNMAALCMQTFGTKWATPEQQNHILLKCGILKEVAVKFNSSRLMMEFVINYSHILNNKEEMIRLTTLPPTIQLIQRPQVNPVFAIAASEQQWQQQQLQMQQQRQQMQPSLANASYSDTARGSVLGPIRHKPGPKSRRSTFAQFARPLPSMAGAQYNVGNQDSGLFVVDNIISNSPQSEHKVFPSHTINNEQVVQPVQETSYGNVPASTGAIPRLLTLAPTNISDDQMTKKLENVIKKNLSSSLTVTRSTNRGQAHATSNAGAGPNARFMGVNSCDISVIDVIDLSSDDEKEDNAIVNTCNAKSHILPTLVNPAVPSREFTSLEAGQTKFKHEDSSDVMVLDDDHSNVRNTNSNSYYSNGRTLSGNSFGSPGENGHFDNTQSESVSVSSQQGGDMGSTNHTLSASSSSTPLSKNGCSHWSVSQAQDLGRKSNLILVANGLDSVQYNSQSSLSGVSQSLCLDDVTGLASDNDSGVVTSFTSPLFSPDPHYYDTKDLYSSSIKPTNDSNNNNNSIRSVRGIFNVLTEDEERYSSAKTTALQTKSVVRLMKIKTTLVPLIIPTQLNNNNNNSASNGFNRGSLLSNQCFCNPNYDWDSKKVLVKGRGSKRIWSGYDSEYEIEGVAHAKKRKKVLKDANLILNSDFEDCYAASKKTSQQLRYNKGLSVTCDMDILESDCDHKVYDSECLNVSGSDDDCPLAPSSTVKVDDEISFKSPHLLDKDSLIFSGKQAYATNHRTLENFYNGGENQVLASSADASQHPSNFISISSDFVNDDSNPKVLHEPDSLTDSLGLLSPVFSKFNEGWNYVRSLISSAPSSPIHESSVESADPGLDDIRGVGRGTNSKVHSSPTDMCSEKSTITYNSERFSDKLGSKSSRELRKMMADECKELSGMKQLLGLETSNRMLTRHHLSEIRPATLGKGRDDVAQTSPNKENTACKTINKSYLKKSVHNKGKNTLPYYASSNNSSLSKGIFHASCVLPQSEPKSGDRRNSLRLNSSLHSYKEISTDESSNESACLSEKCGLPCKNVPVQTLPASTQLQQETTSIDSVATILDESVFTNFNSGLLSNALSCAFNLHLPKILEASFQSHNRQTETCLNYPRQSSSLFSKVGDNSNKNKFRRSPSIMDSITKGRHSLSKQSRAYSNNSHLLSSDCEADSSEDCLQLSRPESPLFTPISSTISCSSVPPMSNSSSYPFQMPSNVLSHQNNVHRVFEVSSSENSDTELSLKSNTRLHSLRLSPSNKNSSGKLSHGNISLYPSLQDSSISSTIYTKYDNKLKNLPNRSHKLPRKRVLTKKKLFSSNNRQSNLKCKTKEKKSAYSGKINKLLKMLTGDECKEFNKFDFHPRDVVLSYAQDHRHFTESSSDENKSGHSSDENKSGNSSSSDSGTISFKQAESTCSSEFPDGPGNDESRQLGKQVHRSFKYLERASCQSNNGKSLCLVRKSLNNLSDFSKLCILPPKRQVAVKHTRPKRKGWTMLRNLMQDECKEFRNSGFHPSTIVENNLSKIAHDKDCSDTRSSTPSDSDFQTDDENSDLESFNNTVPKTSEPVNISQNKCSMPLELQKLLRDECKEFQKFGFHPKDVVHTFKTAGIGLEESDSVEKDSGDKDEKSKVNQPKKPQPSKELRNLYIDEWKEGHKKSSNKSSHWNVRNGNFILRRSQLAVPPNTQKPSQASIRASSLYGSVRAQRSTNQPQSSMLNAPPFPETGRAIHRSMVQSEGAMCVVNYLIPEIT